MPVETVQAEWVREQVFLLRDRFDFPVVMTQPMGINGADLLPLSLLGCALWDICGILQKQRQALTRVEGRAVSTRDDSPPWRFRKIHLHYAFTGHALNERQIQRAIELTHTKYCSIYVTLQAAVELTSDYEIVEG